LRDIGWKKMWKKYLQNEGDVDVVGYFLGHACCDSPKKREIGMGIIMTKYVCVLYRFFVRKGVV
jgi:hypothetical protein